MMAKIGLVTGTVQRERVKCVDISKKKKKKKKKKQNIKATPRLEQRGKPLIVNINVSHKLTRASCSIKAHFPLFPNYAVLGG